MANNNNYNDFNSSVTILSLGTTVKGNIYAKGDVRVDGKIDGHIECDGKIVAGDTSQLQVDVQTNEMNLNGTFQGEIKAEKQLNIGPKGNITGVFSTPILSVEEGAVLNGNINMPEREQ